LRLFAIFLWFICFNWIFPKNTSLNCRCIESWNVMNGKILFVLLSVVWGRIQEHARNFERLVQKTRPPTCERMVFKLYKMQTKSENHETCRDVSLSHVEAVIKILEGFADVDTHDAYKPDIFTRDLPTSFAFYIIPDISTRDLPTSFAFYII
jgi:hypothetical protein